MELHEYTLHMRQARLRHAGGIYRFFLSSLH